MMKCRFCSSELAAGTHVCPYCGHRLISLEISDSTAVLVGVLLLGAGILIVGLQLGGYAPPLGSLTGFAAILIMIAVFVVLVRRRKA